VNLETGTSVDANLYLNPLYNGVFTRYILEIDRVLGRVYLNDGTYWDVDFWDYSRLDSWLRNDTVIIGVNNSSSILYPYTLINVNVNASYGKSVAHVSLLN
jgi:hypothetical protein